MVECKLECGKIELPVLKLQGQGNDYIFLDYFEHKYPEIDYIDLAVKISDRHFGLGSDGLVLVLPHEQCDAEMRIFNADGSEAEMCGTALRCVTSLLKFHNPESCFFRVLTKSGVKRCYVENSGFKVEIGKVSYFSQKKICVHGYSGFFVNTGNPHFVLFDQPQSVQPDIAADISGSSSFDKGTNIENISKVTGDSISVTIWERGSGLTLACGTGATASAFVAMQEKELSETVTVKMPGGEVVINCDKEGVFWLSGKVKQVYAGCFVYE